MGDADASKPELKLPYPKIGDVVQFPGKWEGDFGIGQIRFLQRIQCVRRICIYAFMAWIHTN